MWSSLRGHPPAGSWVSLLARRVPEVAAVVHVIGRGGRGGARQALEGGGDLEGAQVVEGAASTTRHSISTLKSSSSCISQCG